MKEKQLRVRQICLFFLAFTCTNKLFTLPSTIASVSFNDLWLSTLLNVLLDGTSIFLMLILSKNTDKNIYEILEDLMGKIGAKIVCALYLICFFIKSLIPIIEQKEYIDLTLYISSPSIIYFLPFFIVCFYLCTKKLRVLGRLSDVLFISTITGFIVLMALSIPHADFSNVLPVGVNGIKKILSGSFLSLTWFGDAVYFLFFIGNYNRTKKDGKKILLSYFISALSIVLFMIVFYGIFSSISYRQKFSLTEISKYTTIINSTGRFDYFAILLLLVSNLISISLPLFFCSKLLNYIFSIKNRYVSPLIVTFLAFFTIVILTQHVFSTQKIIISVIGLIFLIFFNVLPLIFLLVFKRRNNENS